MDTKQVLEVWFAFGEDAEVIDAGEGRLAQRAPNCGDFVDRRPGPRSVTGARSTRAGWTMTMRKT